MEFPADFLARERALLGERFVELYTYATPEPARGITVNTLRCPASRVAEQADFSVTASPFCASAFTTAPDWRPGRHPWHHAGVFYAQEPSASAPAALLDVRPGMRVADLCAAPGGKTSQLAAALQGEGLLVANEFVASRAEILRQNLERMGVTNALVTNADTARLAATWPGRFDRVLVDAPCSGEGMFRKEAAAATQHDAALVDHCAELGAEILENAATLLAPGGVLVYSTCTFAPQEDEAQIASFLDRHPEFSLCDLSDCGFGRPGESNRAPEGFPAERCRRIWPADGGEGHFMAKLQKAADAEAPQPGRSKPVRPAKVPPEWYAFAESCFPQLAQHPVTLAGEWVLLPPTESAQLPMGKIRLLRSGVLAGSVVKKRFQPAHALFMAYGTQCTNREELTRDDPRTAAWLRGEEIDARTAQNGWCAVCVDGFPLGGGKVSGGRIKNHYPKGLRNLG
ncbi:RsmB/NOP family class I SAM-dependent RNA methyltransferase [uncultured Subdoligranulum sp.]|uniref:RsmB/NOP family class I SAM-dependent RNA methyltransferase n=1 Tax=uncultured Subdoligranulum sp. TaxID=512298 RepID=UPI002620A50A|nr:RsmB/NOP family class I SAM-dependent RNA methyltransferase [uncultured Subdoligranulum sp.]